MQCLSFLMTWRVKGIVETNDSLVVLHISVLALWELFMVPVISDDLALVTSTNKEHYSHKELYIKTFPFQLCL